MILVLALSLLIGSCNINSKKINEYNELLVDNLDMNESHNENDIYSVPTIMVKDNNDSLVLNYYSSLINSSNKNLNSLSFSDSLFDFVTLINKELVENGNNIVLYSYLIKIEPFVDGATGEYISNIYFNLFETDPVLFYQVLYRRDELLSKLESKDLSLQLELIGQKCAFKESELAGYTKRLESKHILLFDNKSMKNKVKKVFRFIKKYYL